MVIKVSDIDQKVTKLISAKKLGELKEKASEKLGFHVVKIVRLKDGIEIEDDDVLTDLAKEGELHIIALGDFEEFIPDKLSSGSRIKDSVTLLTSKKDQTKPIESKKPILKSLMEYTMKPMETPKIPDLSGDDSSENEENDILESINDLKRKLKNFKINLGPSVDRSSKDSSINDSLHEMSTKEFENKKKEMEEKVRKEEDKRRKYEERMKELGTLNKSLVKAQKEKEEKKNAFEKKKFETTVAINKTKSEIADMELDEQRLEIKKHKISLLFEEFKNAEKVDLVFMIDCTGSMSSYINEVKMVVHKITAKLVKIFQDFDLRVAFVGYRDHSDGQKRVIVFPFTISDDSFKSFVNGVEATGGGDECEDIFGGLEEVGKLEWKNPSRVLFHIGDAPCHGNRFHNGACEYPIYDEYPDGDPRGLNISDLLRKINDLNINYYFTEINNSTYKMIDEFNKELSFIGGNQVKIVKLASASDLTTTVYSSIATTIHATKSLSMATTRDNKMKKVKVDSKALNWSKLNLKKYSADLLMAIFNGGIENTKDKDAIQFKPVKVDILMQNTPFAKGSVRFAYAAILLRDGKEKKCVLKETCFEDVQSNSMSHYKKLIESQLVAITLAENFFEISPSTKSIKFLHVDLLQVIETGKYYTIEEYMGESFEKWSNNAGGINEEIYASTLDTFSHWTYCITDGYLLVSDLQGFVYGSSYILTDPAISSAVDLERFSNTNLGNKGIKRFFKTHKCNHICKKLNLKKHEFQSKEDRVTSIGATKIHH